MKRSTGLLFAVLIVAVSLTTAGCAPNRHHQGMKIYQPDDAVAAARQLRPAAERGDAEAQFRLGSLYQQGRGVPQNHREASIWFRQAADQGHPAAQVILGNMFSEGHRGVTERDYSQALKWYILAAAQGDREALRLRDRLAVRMTPDQIGEAQRLAREFKPADVHTRVLGEMRKLAAEGDSSAQLRMGLAYYFGHGVARNHVEAIRWFKIAGDNGNPYAQANVGYMYEKGEGAPQDFPKAALWYQRAAEQGNVQAQFSLGSMFERGAGVLQDEIQALKWFTLAAARGDVRARNARDRITVWMTPDQIAEAQRRAREITPGKKTNTGK